MSAYVVSDATITAIVRAGIATKLINPASATLVGQALKFECVASVSARYPGDIAIGEALPGRTDDLACQPIERTGVRGEGGMALRSASYRYVRRAEGEGRLNMAVVRGCIANYGYQSCEHRQWDDSPAKAFIERLDAILHSRGFEAEGFGIDDISEAVQS